jgi:hypothetical protein
MKKIARSAIVVAVATLSLAGSLWVSNSQVLPIHNDHFTGVMVGNAYHGVVAGYGVENGFLFQSAVVE